MKQDGKGVTWQIHPNLLSKERLVDQSLFLGCREKAAIVQGVLRAVCMATACVAVVRVRWKSKPSAHMSLICGSVRTEQTFLGLELGDAERGEGEHTTSPTTAHGDGDE